MSGLDQWAFTSKFEGIVPHLYKDTRGFTTCGVGFLVKDIDALKKFNWWPNLQEAQADFLLLQEQPAGKLPMFYRKICHARLNEDAMRQFFQNEVIQFRKALQRDWNLSRLPASVQIALTDMAFNLGVDGLSKYRKLRAACQARDWATAAEECHRNGPSEARNRETAELFLEAV
jgi:GH24 family phage-related lysozyme (muramidase)